MLGKAIGVGFLIGFGTTFLGIASLGDDRPQTQASLLSPGSWESPSSGAAIEAARSRLRLLRDDCPSAGTMRSGDLPPIGQTLA